MARLKWTKEKIINFVNDDDNCIFIDFIKFNGTSSRIVFYCKIHKIQCEITFKNFKLGQRCKECSKERRKEGLTKWTNDKIDEYIKDNSNYQLLSIEVFNGLYSTIKLKCNRQHTYIQNFHDFKDGKRCPHCSNNAKLNIDIIKNKIEKEGYTLLSTEYVNAQNNLDVMCDKGHIYTTNWNRFQNGKRCPYCYNEYKQSKGTRKIINYLDSNNITYIQEYKFDDCRLKYPLPFDFYLPQYKILIEFDGQQHFMILEYWGGLDRFIEQKIRDTIKDYYCKENNIKLIRIPYYELENIETILDKLL